MRVCPILRFALLAAENIENIENIVKIFVVR